MNRYGRLSVIITTCSCTQIPLLIHETMMAKVYEASLMAFSTLRPYFRVVETVKMPQHCLASYDHSWEKYFVALCSLDYFNQLWERRCHQLALMPLNGIEPALLCSFLQNALYIIESLLSWSSALGDLFFRRKVFSFNSENNDCLSISVKLKQ